MTTLTRIDCILVIEHLKSALLDDQDMERAAQFGTLNESLQSRENAISILKNFGIELETTYYGTVK